jgi:DNA uptake protein ComE-like DNA-binding protein
MKRFFWEYIYLSPAERRGLVVLLVICVGSFVVPRVYEYYYVKPTYDFSEIEAQYAASFGQLDRSDVPQRDSLFYFDPNKASFDDFIMLGLSERTANSICNYREKGGYFNQPSDLRKIYTLSKNDYERLQPYIQIVSRRGRSDKWKGRAGSGHFNDQEEQPTVAAKGERFEFDPNMVAEADLKRMALSSKLIKSWLNYRSKGGRFKRAEDLGKLYSMDEGTLQSLLPFVVIVQALPVAAAAPAPATYSGGTNQPAKVVPKQYNTIDINQAEVAEWSQLPGIGDAYAKRIINFRQKLGGFVHIEQVKETRGLPDSIYQRAKPYLTVAGVSIKKVDLNTATQQELAMHPYFDGAQARMIIQYRERHGLFKAYKDLDKIAGLTPDWLSKVRPYVSPD